MFQKAYPDYLDITVTSNPEEVIAMIPSLYGLVISDLFFGDGNINGAELGLYLKNNKWINDPNHILFISGDIDVVEDQCALVRVNPDTS